MNVQAKDLAIVKNPKYPDNKNEVCIVVQRVQNVELCKGGVWWFVKFSRHVMTEFGRLPFAIVSDAELLKVVNETCVIRRQGKSNRMALPA